MIFRIDFDNNTKTFDHGWSEQNNVYTKGTTSIDFNTKKIVVDRWLTPVYQKGTAISTMPFAASPECSQHLIPYDHTAMNEYVPEWHIEPLAVTVSLDAYVDVIVNNIAKQFNKQEKYMLGQSNGLDCLMIQSIMDYFGINYETVSYTKRQQHNDKIFNQLQKLHWGFNQTPYFDQPINYVTGMYGDEYILRNPMYVQWLLDDINLDNEFQKKQDCYMFKFYSKGYQSKVKDFTPNKDFLNNILNDYQLWNYNHVNVINPCKDKQILLQGLCLDKDIIIQQVTDGLVSKTIIKKCNQKLLSNLDNQKNSSDAEILEWKSK